MNQELSHKHIISILLPFAFLLIAYFWSYGKSTDVTHPLILKKTPWQTLVLPLSNGDIYEFTESGRLKRTIHSADFGIDNFIGDIQFLSTNEFIIYGGFKGTNTQDNLTAFARITPNTAFNHQEGLWRCTIDIQQCSPFTHELPSIKQAFHLSHDLENDHIYLTNTSHHMLYRFDLNGDILAKSNEDELIFPNQIRIFDNQLWLADTNNKQINYYDLDKGSIATSKGFFPISLNSQCGVRSNKNPLSMFETSPACWPTSLAKVDNDLWVGVKDNAMENGEIHIYSQSGILKSKLDLSGLDAHYTPDPISMVQINEHVIFSDLNNNGLYRYNLNHKQWLELPVTELDLVLKESLDNKIFYRGISHGVIIIFALLVSIGLVIGLKQSKQNKEEFEAVSVEDAILPQPKGMPFWFSPSKISKYGGWIVSATFIAVLICFYFLNQILEFKEPEAEFNFLMIELAFVSIVFPSLLMLHFSNNKRLGIAGRLMLVSQKNNETAIKPVQDVYKVGNRGLLIENVLFVFGKGNGILINKLEFQHYLEPRLAVMKTMSEWEYLTFRMKNLNKESKIQALSFVPATVIFTFLAITGQI
jgi:hypothetical protein